MKSIFSLFFRTQSTLFAPISAILLGLFFNVPAMANIESLSYKPFKPEFDFYSQSSYKTVDSNLVQFSRLHVYSLIENNFSAYFRGAIQTDSLSNSNYQFNRRYIGLGFGVRQVFKPFHQVFLDSTYIYEKNTGSIENRLGWIFFYQTSVLLSVSFETYSDFIYSSLNKDGILTFIPRLSTNTFSFNSVQAGPFVESQLVLDSMKDPTQNYLSGKLGWQFKLLVNKISLRSFVSYDSTTFLYKPQSTQNGLNALFVMGAQW